MKYQIKIKITSSWKMKAVAKLRGGLGVPSRSPKAAISEGAAVPPHGPSQSPRLVLVVSGSDCEGQQQFPHK